MKTIDEIRRDNLQLATQRVGTAAALAEKAGLAAAYLSQVKNQTPDSKTGKPKNMGDDAARKIEAALGVAKGWMDTDHTSSSDDSQSTEQKSDIIKRLLPDEKGNVIAWETEDDLPDDPNRVWIDRYDYTFSAGTGVIQWEVREKKALPFDRGFFKALGAKPDNCKLVVVRGDSMEPFLFNRDMMMIDAARTTIREGHIYAIHFEDEALVKQIFKQAGGGLLLRSYNAAKYPDKLISPEQAETVTIAGELIYRSGSGPAGGN